MTAIFRTQVSSYADKGPSISYVLWTSDDNKKWVKAVDTWCMPAEAVGLLAGTEPDPRFTYTLDRLASGEWPGGLYCNVVCGYHLSVVRFFWDAGFKHDPSKPDTTKKGAVVCLMAGGFHDTLAEPDLGSGKKVHRDHIVRCSYFGGKWNPPDDRQFIGDKTEKKLPEWEIHPGDLTGGVFLHPTGSKPNVPIMLFGGEGGNLGYYDCTTVEGFEGTLVATGDAAKDRALVKFSQAHPALPDLLFERGETDPQLVSEGEPPLWFRASVHEGKGNIMGRFLSAQERAKAKDSMSGKVFTCWSWDGLTWFGGFVTATPVLGKTTMAKAMESQIKLESSVVPEAPATLPAAEGTDVAKDGDKGGDTSNPGPAPKPTGGKGARKAKPKT